MGIGQAVHYTPTEISTTEVMGLIGVNPGSILNKMGCRDPQILGCGRG